MPLIAVIFWNNCYKNYLTLQKRITLVFSQLEGGRIRGEGGGAKSGTFMDF